MPPDPITATVTIMTPEQSHALRDGEHGALIVMPSEFAETGQAYVAFAIKGGRLTSHEIDLAAYSLARFNRESDRLREYQIAIQRAHDAT